MKQGLKTLLYIVNVILYLVIIAIWLAIPEHFLFCLAVTTFNLILTAILIIWDRDRVRDYYMSSHFRSFSQSLLAGILLFCILGLVNYLGYKNPSHFDTTLAQRNSLTEQTHQILDTAEGSLRFDIYARGPDFTAIRTLVELYRLQKNDIDLNYIDVELRPDLVEAAGVTQAGTILISYDGRQERVEELSELKITNALVRLTRERDPQIYFVTGFGGHELEGEGNSDLSHLTQLISRSNFEVRRINLMGIDHIPLDADAVVIWGPQTTLEEDEIAKIEKYLSDGDGNLIVGVNPDLNRDRQPELRSFLKNFGVDLRNDLVIDQLKHVSGSDGTVPLVDKFSNDSPIEKNFSGSVFFPLVSSVLPYERSLSIERLEALEVEPALKTTPFPASWAEQNMEEVVAGNVSFDEGEDIRGPIPLAATVEHIVSDELKNRIVVFGNSTFVTNSYQRFEKNYQLFLNSISWVSGEDRLISLNVPVLSNEPVFISTPQLGVIFYFSVIFAPLILFAMALLVYRRKVTA